MRIIHHPLARLDVLNIVEYYEKKAGTDVAAEFFAELLSCIDQIAARPLSFPLTSKRLRRTNLSRFPHHILFEIQDGNIAFILVVRHDHRHPDFGLDR